MRKHLRKLALMLAVMLCFSTAFSIPVEAASVVIKKVSVVNSLTGSSKTVVVAKGKTVKLTTTVTAKPDKTANKKVTYKTLNSKVAKVSAKGVIKGIKPGKTKIVVTSVKNPKKKTTINVTVKKTAVSGVSMSKPASTSLYIGDSISLKAKAQGKKTSYKTLVWRTSDKSIATVSKNGTVTAIKAGNVTITASAVDGSNKKSSVTLTVKAKPTPQPTPAKTETVSIVSASVSNPATVAFKLSKAKALNKNEVKLYTKELYTGAYRATLVVSELATKDNINYSVTLDTNSVIYNRYFVKVSIPSLDGTKEFETQYNEAVTTYDNEYIVSLTVNQPISGYVYSDGIGLSFSQAEGLCSQSITGLPKGINFKFKNNMAFLFGTPTTVGTTTATYTAIDEVGNKYTQKIKFIIGSETVISATSITRYAYYPMNGNVSIEILATGGSGSYKYSFANGAETYGCYISGRYVFGTFNAAGTYTIPIVVTDSNNPNITTTTNVTFIIKKGLTLSGIAKDAEGNPLYGVRIQLTNKNKGDNYSSSPSLRTNADGSYNAAIIPGTYDIRISYKIGTSDNLEYYKYIYNQTINESKSGVDFTLPLYKVIFNLPSGTNPADFSSEWKDSSGNIYKSGNTLYLLPGTYSLEAAFSKNSWYDEYSITGLRTTFAITNKSITVNTTPIRDTQVLQIYGTISHCRTNSLSGSVNKSPNYAIFKYTPQDDCTIKYKDNHEESDSDDILFDIYDKTTNTILATALDEQGSIRFSKNHEYLIRVRSNFSSSSFTYSFTFTNEALAEN